MVVMVKCVHQTIVRCLEYSFASQPRRQLAKFILRGSYAVQRTSRGVLLIYSDRHVAPQTIFAQLQALFPSTSTLVSLSLDLVQVNRHLSCTTCLSFHSEPLPTQVSCNIASSRLHQSLLPSKCEGCVL